MKQEWHSLQVSYKRDKAVIKEIEQSTIPHGSILTTWNFLMMLQTLTNLTLCLIVNLMFPIKKKEGEKKGRMECKNAVIEVFNRIIEVKNAGGACLRTEIR